MGAGILALAVVGIASALLLANSETPQASTTTQEEITTSTTPPVARPTPTTITAIGISAREDGLGATLRLRGTDLRPGAIAMRDRDLSDGRAWFELRQRNLASLVKRVVRSGLSVRVRKAPDRLRVDLAAEPGSFDTVRALRRNGDSVAVLVSAAPVSPPEQTTTEPPPSNRPTTTERETTPTNPPAKPPPKPKPPLNTG